VAVLTRVHFVLILAVFAIGVLAVTRALGDSSMKEFIIGAPYTTRTEIGADNPYLILACDGVSIFLLLMIIITLPHAPRPTIRHGEE
jgi:hypothetical protein